jgi:hypothetical protein
MTVLEFLFQRDAALTSSLSSLWYKQGAPPLLTAKCRGGGGPFLGLFLHRKYTITQIFEHMLLSPAASVSV